MSIESHAEYRAAKWRIVALGELPEGTAGAETELTVLVELTTAWEADHPADADGAGEPVPVPSAKSGHD